MRACNNPQNLGWFAALWLFQSCGIFHLWSRMVNTMDKDVLRCCFHMGDLTTNLLGFRSPSRLEKDNEHKEKCGQLGDYVAHFAVCLHLMCM